MIQIQDKARAVGIAVILGIIGLWIANQLLGKEYDVNAFILILIILGILWVVFKFIMIIEKKLVMSRQELIILIFIAAILIILILVLFKTKLVPENFFGAVEDIGRFSSL